MSRTKNPITHPGDPVSNLHEDECLGDFIDDPEESLFDKLIKNLGTITVRLILLLGSLIIVGAVFYLMIRALFKLNL